MFAKSFFILCLLLNLQMFLIYQSFLLTPPQYPQTMSAVIVTIVILQKILRNYLASTITDIFVPFIHFTSGSMAHNHRNERKRQK